MPDTVGVLVSKRTVYIGGLVAECHESLVRAAALPFGPVKQVEIPRDYKTGEHRGFAFVEFDDPDDAAECIFNLNGAELLGRSLNVSLAQPNRHSLGSDKAVWSTDAWFKEHSLGAAHNQSIEQEHVDAAVLKDSGPPVGA